MGLPFKILVADDEEGWRELLSRWLKDAGYELRVVSKGLDVLVLAKDFHPDCFILDHDLGDTTGFNVCTGLKAHPEYKTLPVVLLTANVDLMPKIANNCPADLFVSKSDNPDELLLVLGTLAPKLDDKAPK